MGNAIIPVFSGQTLPELCDTLAHQDPDLAAIIQQYGYPPFWDRPNSFETLVHIILEQQVSLASAKAALEKLRQHMGTITPEQLLAIPDDRFTSLYVSRQKRTYLQGLAKAIVSKELVLSNLSTASDDAVIKQLTELKGIGAWTADIYLIMVLHRSNRFPIGDVAAVTALKDIKQLPKRVDSSQLTDITDKWQPYRSVAAMILWHYYLTSRNRTY